MLLKIAIFICLFYCSINVGIFISSRIPPYSEKTCLYYEEYPYPIIFIVLKNRILEGYSDLGVLQYPAYISISSYVKANFVDLRSSYPIVIKCPSNYN